MDHIETLLEVPDIGAPTLGSGQVLSYCWTLDLTVKFIFSGAFLDKASEEVVQVLATCLTELCGMSHNTWIKILCAAAQDRKGHIGKSTFAGPATHGRGVMRFTGVGTIDSIEPTETPRTWTIRGNDIALSGPCMFLWSCFVSGLIKTAGHVVPPGEAVQSWLTLEPPEYLRQIHKLANAGHVVTFSTLHKSPTMKKKAELTTQDESTQDRLPYTPEQSTSGRTMRLTLWDRIFHRGGKKIVDITVGVSEVSNSPSTLSLCIQLKTKPSRWFLCFPYWLPTVHSHYAGNPRILGAKSRRLRSSPAQSSLEHMEKRLISVTYGSNWWLRIKLNLSTSLRVWICLLFREISLKSVFLCLA